MTLSRSKYIIISTLFIILPLLFIFNTVGASTSSSTVSCTELTQNMLLGTSKTSSKGDLTKLHSFLKQKGYLSTRASASYFNYSTFTAVRKFQKEYNLEETGSATKETRAKIKALTCTTTSTSSTTSTGTESTATPATGAKTVQLWLTGPAGAACNTADAASVKSAVCPNGTLTSCKVTENSMVDTAEYTAINCDAAPAQKRYGSLTQVPDVSSLEYASYYQLVMKNIEVPVLATGLPTAYAKVVGASCTEDHTIYTLTSKQLTCQSTASGPKCSFPARKFVQKCEATSSVTPTTTTTPTPTATGVQTAQLFLTGLAGQSCNTADKAYVKSQLCPSGTITSCKITQNGTGGDTVEYAGTGCTASVTPAPAPTTNTTSVPAGTVQTALLFLTGNAGASCNTADKTTVKNELCPGGTITSCKITNNSAGGDTVEYTATNCPAGPVSYAFGPLTQVPGIVGVPYSFGLAGYSIQDLASGMPTKGVYPVGSNCSRDNIVFTRSSSQLQSNNAALGAWCASATCWPGSEFIQKCEPAI